MSVAGKHTPGPWVFTKENGDRYIRADGDSMMCDTGYYPWCPSGDANWHLIAASPDLLEACRAVMAWWDDHKYDVDDDGETEWNRYDSEPEFVVAASAAIAKAEGRS